jgi:hypothetical protein
LVARTFTFEPDETCKQEWIFTLEDGPEGVVVGDLDVREIGDRQGCSGHPATIVALVRGRTLGSIDVDALSEAACGRDLACGQALAMCLRKLVEEPLAGSGAVE